MQIVLKKCPKCQSLKEFWLKDSDEEGFFCKCGYNHAMMRNYHTSSFKEAFEYSMGEALTIDDVIKMVNNEHLHVDEVQLRKDLQIFNFPLSSLQEAYDVVAVIVKNLDYDYFRKILVRYTDFEEMLKAIEKLNPRIDIPSLRSYLSKSNLPLSKNDVLLMEKMIVEHFYHPDIYYEPT